MSHVKAFAAGRYASHAQALLNELARARVTLLNSKQKAAYDRRLLDQAPLAIPQQPHSPAKPVAASHATAEGLQRTREQRHDLAIRVRTISRKRTAPVATYMVLVVGVLSIALALYYAFLTKPVPKKPLTQASQPRTAPQESPSEKQLPPGRKYLKPAPPKVRVPQVDPQPIDPSAELRMEPIPKDGDGRNKARPSPLIKEVDLNLHKSRQRYELKHPETASLRVKSIQGCDAPVSIDPASGDLQKSAAVTVTIEGSRDIVINIRRQADATGPAYILLEYQFISSSGDPDPLRLPNLERLQRRLIKQGENAASAVFDMEAEQRRVRAWLAAPVAKPLAARGQAKARLLDLDVTIREQSSIVQSYQADVADLQRLISLAEHLHEDCALEVAISE
jgi:hypothetical protein